MRRCHEEGVDMRLLGQGSNILVRDEGVPGMVIRLSAPAFCEIRVEGRSIIAGGGALLGRAVTTAVHRGLAGLETLIGIPGTVGGALHGNAGTHGGNIGQWTLEATVITASGEVCQRSSDELVFGYRQSSLDDLVILEASCELEEDDPRELAQRMQKQWIVKKASQPMGHQSAGCVFKNPRGASAGELIDDAGLKGTRIGGAVVSDRHANFIIAEPECTAQDVLRLIELVRRPGPRPDGHRVGDGTGNLVSGKTVLGLGSRSWGLGLGIGNKFPRPKPQDQIPFPESHTATPMSPAKKQTSSSASGWLGSLFSWLLGPGRPVLIFVLVVGAVRRRSLLGLVQAQAADSQLARVSRRPRAGRNHAAAALDSQRHPRIPREVFRDPDARRSAVDHGRRSGGADRQGVFAAPLGGQGRARHASIIRRR